MSICLFYSPSELKNSPRIYKNIQQARGKILRPLHPVAEPTPTPPVTINDAHKFHSLPHRQHPVPAPVSIPISYSSAVTHHQQPAKIPPLPHSRHSAPAPVSPLYNTPVLSLTTSSRPTLQISCPPSSMNLKRCSTN